MSYDPTVGRWIEQDPAGYIDGPNTYQMEESNPVGLLDPSGMNTISVTPTENSSIIELPNNGNVHLADGNEGTIQISPDYDGIETSDNGQKSAEYLRAISVQLIANTGCKKYHWLQFFRDEVTNDKGQKLSGITVGAGGYYKLGETYVDSSDPLIAFYDASGSSEITDTQSTILDQPDVSGLLDQFKDDGGTTAREFVDDFLVSDSGDVVYHVHWERVAHSDDTREYENVSGEATTKLPGWAASDTLLGGYTDDKATVKGTEYPNPVKKEFR